MSESEQRGRCRQQLEAWYANNISSVPRYSWMIADAIDRLAADVESVMEMTQEIALRVPSEFGQDACDVAVRVALKERDAAVRERDEARAIAADVAAIKAKVDAVSPEDVRHFVDSEKAWVAMIEQQRDAAIRECKEARALLELAQVQRTAAYADRDEARAEVYRLKCSMTETSKERDAAIRERDQWREEARLAVINRDEARAEVERLRGELAARQAADVQPIGWIAQHNHAPPVGKYVMCRWDVEARQGYARQVSYGAAKRGPDGMWRSPAGVEKIAPMHWMPLPPGVDGGDEWEQQPPAAPQPAGQGISPGLPETQSAENAAPAAGWLTDEERHILGVHLQSLRDQRRAMERGGQTLGYSADPCGLKREADVIDNLLARAGSQPVVQVPELGFLGPMTGREQGIVLAYRDALGAAGVKWKEVGRE